MFILELQVIKVNSLINLVIKELFFVFCELEPLLLGVGQSAVDRKDAKAHTDMVDR